MKDDTALLEEIIGRHEDLIISLGKALAEITNAVRGEPPAGSSWGTHDVEKRVKRRLAQDEALLRQALEALENSAVKHPQQIEGKNAAIAALRKRLNLCPACGCDTTQNHDFVGNVETFWKTCSECDWAGEPE